MDMAGLLALVGAVGRGLLRLLSALIPRVGRRTRQPAPTRKRIDKRRVAMSAASAATPQQPAPAATTTTTTTSTSPAKLQQPPATTKLEEQATAKADLSYTYWARPDRPANSAEPPRKLTPEEAAALAASSSAASSSGAAAASAWNRAGTFEEKAITDWAKQQLQTRLVGLGSDAAAAATTTGVNSIEGDAHVWFIRGKKRYGFEFSISIAWQTSGGGGAKGTIRLPSASPDDLDDLHMEVELAPGQQAADGGQQALRDARALKGPLERTLQQFYADMKQTL